MVNPNPWKPDPKDERTPIGPGDVVTMSDSFRISEAQ